MSDSTLSLLIVDDDQEIRELLEKILIKYNYQVFSAGDGVEMFKVLEAEEIDLILLDIYLEETTAIELIPEVKRIKPGIDIITMTGQSSRELEKEIRSLGIIYYMEKPIETANLKSILEHMESRLIKQ